MASPLSQQAEPEEAAAATASPAVLESFKILAKRFIGDVVNRHLYSQEQQQHDDNGDMNNMMNRRSTVATTAAVTATAAGSSRSNQVSTLQLDETVQVKMQVMSELNQAHDAMMMDSSLIATTSITHGVDDTVDDGLPTFNVRISFLLNGV